MEFNGFCPETGDFFWNLKFNNNKDWFNAHREEYEKFVHTPLKALAYFVFDEMNEKYPNDVFKLHISRINRDARRPSPFGPYKDHMWFSIFNAFEREYSRPSFYFGISSDGYDFGMGIYDTNQQLMTDYRKIILERSPETEKLARDFAKQNVFILGGENYKKSKGDAGKYLTEWLNKKQLYFNCDRPYGEEIFSGEFRKELASHFDFLMPYYKFIEKICLTSENM